MENETKFNKFMSYGNEPFDEKVLFRKGKTIRKIINILLKAAIVCFSVSLLFLIMVGIADADNWYDDYFYSMLYIFISFASLTVALLIMCLPLYFLSLHYKGLALIADYCRLTAINTRPSAPAAQKVEAAPADEVKTE